MTLAGSGAELGTELSTHEVITALALVVGTGTFHQDASTILNASSGLT